MGTRTRQTRGPRETPHGEADRARRWGWRRPRPEPIRSTEVSVRRVLDGLSGASRSGRVDRAGSRISARLPRNEVPISMGSKRAHGLRKGSDGAALRKGRMFARHEGDVFVPPPSMTRSTHPNERCGFHSIDPTLRSGRTGSDPALPRECGRRARQGRSLAGHPNVDTSPIPSIRPVRLDSPVPRDRTRPPLSPRAHAPPGHMRGDFAHVSEDDEERPP